MKRTGPKKPKDMTSEQRMKSRQKFNTKQKKNSKKKTIHPHARNKERREKDKDWMDKMFQR